MPLVTGQDGKLEKLKLIAYKDNKFQQKDDSVKEYEVKFNPPEFVEDLQIRYTPAQAPGSSGAAPKFNDLKPKNFNLDLFFDATGVSNDRNTDENYQDERGANVKEQVENLKKVVFEMNGEIHQPRYVMISWGNLVFKGRLLELTISYTLFASDGRPIRAKGKAKFEEVIADEIRTRWEDKQSPDLTKLRVVNEGDTLPQLCFKEYGDSNYYMKIAEVNGLVDFRNLQTGMELYFPPIDQSDI